MLTYALVILSIAFAVQTVRVWRLKRRCREMAKLNKALRAINRAAIRQSVESEWPDEIV